MNKMFESLNRKRTVCADVDTSEMEFKKLKDFANQNLQCKGFFFTINRFTGERQVVVVTDTYLVNMPRRAVAQFEKIEESPQMLDAVLNGHLTIEVHDMVKTRNGATIEYKLVG